MRYPLTLILMAMLIIFSSDSQAQISSIDEAGKCRFPIANWLVPGDNMLPGLRSGEVIWTVCLKHAVLDIEQPAVSLELFEKLRVVQRGDIVIVRIPGQGPRVVAPMRLIGLPGDRLRIKQSVVQLNGNDVPREQMPDWRTMDRGREEVLEHFREVLPNGKSYTVLSRSGPWPPGIKDMQERIIPPGRVFLLGDNRTNSVDSRAAVFGNVSFENLVGVVVVDDVELTQIFIGIFTAIDLLLKK